MGLSNYRLVGWAEKSDQTIILIAHKLSTGFILDFPSIFTAGLFHSQTSNMIGIDGPLNIGI